MRTRGNEPDVTTEIKDLFCQKLVEFLPFDSQAAKPAILFMNGEYYGFQSVRERFDRYYLENKYNVGNDNVDLIQLILGKPAPNNYEVEEGDDVAYKVLMELVHNSDLTDPINFEKLQTLIDLDGYTDYQIAQTFIGNVDWPHNNLRLWRAKTANLKPGARAEHDGRWRFMFFDTDMLFTVGPIKALTWELPESKRLGFFSTSYFKTRITAKFLPAAWPIWLTPILRRPGLPVFWMS